MELWESSVGEDAVCHSQTHRAAYWPVSYLSLLVFFDSLGRFEFLPVDQIFCPLQAESLPWRIFQQFLIIIFSFHTVIFSLKFSLLCSILERKLWHAVHSDRPFVTSQASSRHGQYWTSKYNAAKFAVPQKNTANLTWLSIYRFNSKLTNERNVAALRVQTERLRRQTGQ